jgi:hypothetical protein
MWGGHPDACASVRVAGAASADRGSSDLPGYIFRVLKVVVSTRCTCSYFVFTTGVWFNNANIMLFGEWLLGLVIDLVLR